MFSCYLFGFRYKVKKKIHAIVKNVFLLKNRLNDNRGAGEAAYSDT